MKHDISKHPYWSHDEFLAFLMYYAAYADMECTEDERKMIIKLISEEHLSAIEKEYDRLNDIERIKVIQAYKPKYYKTAAQKNEVIEKIKAICNADGEFDIMEQNMVMMMGRIL